MKCMKHSSSWVQIQRISHWLRYANSSLNFTLYSHAASFSAITDCSRSLRGLCWCFCIHWHFEWPSREKKLLPKNGKEVGWMYNVQCTCMYRAHVYSFEMHCTCQQHRLMFITQHYCYYDFSTCAIWAHNFSSFLQHFYSNCSFDLENKKKCSNKNSNNNNSSNRSTKHTLHTMEPWRKKIHTSMKESKLTLKTIFFCQNCCGSFYLACTRCY